MRNIIVAASLFIGMISLTVPHHVAAQSLPAMGPPIRTNLTLTKPAPDEIFGNKSTVTMGVGDKVYRFILKDAYTDNLKIRWPDIWQYVQQHNPNFVVQG